MKFYFLLGFFLLFLALNVAATSCGNPDISIGVSSTKFYQSGTIDVNLVFSADPAPLSPCHCLFGDNCGMEWQDDASGSWAIIPNSTDAGNDLNCSGVNCKTSNSFPIEDQVYTKTISCVTQKEYHIRGHHVKSGNNSSVITIYCYSSLACMPPATGNFDLNQTCTYNQVPLFVDGNYNLGSNGRAIHNGSDINFFSNGSKFVNIKNGGRIDLNSSSFFAGLNIPLEFGGPLIGGILLFIVLASVFSHRKIVEVVG